MNVPDPDAARDAAEQALAAARDTGDDPAEAGALITLATLDARVGDLDGQLPRLARARAIAESIGADQLRLRALERESHLLHGYGRLHDAERVALAGIAAAAEAGLARSAGPAHAINLVAALISAGRFDEAIESVEHALDLVPPHNDHAHLLAQRAEIAIHRGGLGLAAQLLDHAAELLGGDTALCQEPLLFPRLRLRLHLARGRLREAADVAARALAGDRIAETSRFTWPLLVLGARVAAAAPDLAPAAALRAVAATVPTPTPPQAAAAATVTAHLDDTPQAWARAVAAWDELAHPLELAEALHGHGGALLASGDRPAAAEALRRAAEIAAGLGAAPLHAQIADLARRARLPLDRAAAAAQADDPATRIGLTPREAEVLRLVAAGLGNADIGERLFISPKTASVHVSNILGKLGVANRVEAAAAAHRLGLLPV
ncbi:helix-turn-helix transcriptional regulator [Pseudonocardia nigra]|uniref:helix-turn-helix transcriptional regulator n=1 Tax=Pseudonocardia nigra TaxID=1921578 RepID=UPI001C5EAF62|nr:LuxR family transcriptional regulator [Pseudonocardia nigra]